MGSADPHDTGEVDGAQQRRQRAVALARHTAATDEELMRRPFARANVPPVTAPLAPLPPPLPYPVVTHVDQVVPQPSQRVYSQWMRRLRRCLRLAQCGRGRQAVRMRPADLWLDHAEHSCPATAAWDWDLRPLVSGGVAVPMAVSGQGGVLPATDLQLGAIARWDAVQGCWGGGAAGFADQATISEVMQGVRDDSRCRRGTLLCAPHAGALLGFAVTQEKTTANVTQGWASGGWHMPCWPLRTSPYSLVDESERAGKPKFRLTTDLSWPHRGTMHAAGAEVDSVNGGMDRSRWPSNRLMRVHEFTEAMGIFQGTASRRRRTRAWSIDCQAFYRAVGRQRRELCRNGICCADGVQLDERCCFGDASAAVKCSLLSNYIVFRARRRFREIDAQYPTRDPVWVEWQRERREAAAAAELHDAAEDWACLSWIGQYIDDAAGGGADDLLYSVCGEPVCDAAGEHVRRQRAHFEAFRELLVELGWLSAPGKEQPPSEFVELLGVEVDLAADRMRLSQAKRDRYAPRARAVAAQRFCSVADFREMLGRLQFAVQCYPRGASHTFAAWRAMRASYRVTGQVRVGRAVRADLLWWASRLEDSEYEGVPLAGCEAFPGEEPLVIYADASGEGGFSAWTIVGDEVLMVAGEWTAEERGMLICELELLASTYGLVAFAPGVDRWVVSFTDNTVAQAAMANGRARSPAMQAIIARRSEWMLECGVLEQTRRISSKANVWADVGSRPELGGAGEVVRMAASAGLTLRMLDVPAGWRDTSGLRSDHPEW